MELLYADDPVFCGESLNGVMGKYGRCNNAVEVKGLMVNVDKTKGMQLLFGKKSHALKVDPCGVCREQFGCNSIQCMKCQRWIHHRSDVPRQESPFLRIVHKGVPAPPFYCTHPLTQLAPPPFKNFCFPSPPFCSTLFQGILDSSPHVHATSSSPNLTNQPSLV